MVLYAQDGTLRVISEHRARDNGRAVFVKNGRVVLATGSAEHVLGSLADLTFGRNAVVPDTDALLAAIGACWALDIAPDLIGAGSSGSKVLMPAPLWSGAMSSAQAAPMAASRASVSGTTALRPKVRSDRAPNTCSALPVARTTRPFFTKTARPLSLARC